MDAHPDSQQFAEQLRAFASGRLNYPRDIAVLVDLSWKQNMGQVFRDVIFHAKFAVKTKEVMARIGRDGQGYDKLSGEFQNSVEKTTTLLKTILKEAPADIKERFVNSFFSLDQESFANLAKLLEDLCWVKNWEVDGNSLPLNDDQTPAISGRNPSREAVSWIRKSSVLGLVLILLLLIADPPVTSLGWGIAIVVALLLLVIVLSSHNIKHS